MSRLPGSERSTAKNEMETLASQLVRLRGKILEIEEAIFEVARLYSTLPLGLRKDQARLKESDVEVLEACFFDAVESGQKEFWGRIVGQAKWVALWIERGRGWAEGFGAGLEVNVASRAIEVVRGELLGLEMRVKKVRYELLGFSKEERALFGKQRREEREKCMDGVVRFLWFWPGTEGWVQRGFTGVEEERERDLSREAVEFLGLGEAGMMTADEWLDEEVETETEGSGVDIKMEFFEDEDSGVFLERGRDSVDSGMTPERG
ncbi:Transcription elongation factor [Venturia nashicola]|uniref:Transcription elongation factor n=1 Tax=Venturia nashicola TaxID=86259 RepID=A0A4Z1PQI2_9PEZI|nr:Transcription elongation factor [Venturia nashicola]TLD38309.1 Transcription elongation factor [Venturia nashicola]